MMTNRIIYQLIFQEETDFNPKEEIENKIKELLEYEGISLAVDMVSDYVNVNFYDNIKENKHIIDFCLEIPEEVLPKGDIAKRVLEQFNDWLKNHEKIDFIFKYKDDYLFDNLENYYKEIFEIEMDLREIITFIFVDTYGNDFYNLLRDYHLQLQYNPKNKKDPRKELEERFKNSFENEFFYLLFPNYQNFSETRPIKVEDITYILDSSDNFNDFRNGVNNRGVKKEKYVDFLNSIKEDLCNIEIMRNCVAHNRKPADGEMENYEISKSKIKQKMERFWQ